MLGPGHPHTLDSIWVMAFVLEMQRHYVEARQLVEEELSTERRLLGPGHPGTLDAMRLLARILLKDPDATARDHKRALEFARKVAADGSKDPIHWKWLAVAEYRAGEWAAAIRAMEKCLELMGNDGYAFMWTVLALSHARQGDMDRARAWWEIIRPTLQQSGGMGTSNHREES